MAPVNIRLNPIGAVLLILCVACGFIYNFGLPNMFRKEERVSMKELLSVSIELAKRGGKRVREVREENTLGIKVKSITKEGADELKTRGDMESHREILYGMAKAFPELKVSFIYSTTYLFFVWLIIVYLLKLTVSVFVYVKRKNNFSLSSKQTGVSFCFFIRFFFYHLK